jgi:hypothetical protein
MSETARFLCIHGHYYQPPRENPWTGALERQPSAAPYHDWNARITAECYAPNLRARLLDGTGLVRAAMNTYARSSFNFGPTLMTWFERKRPDVHRAIIEADKRAFARFGSGSALAQVYNHVILPLAHERDQRTQVRWGKADFRSRYGRDPDGMWLAETACSTSSLEALASEDIRFTVLAPRQAARVKPPGGVWEEVNEGTLDPRRAYKATLPSGREISLFFYDGEISQAVAFERLLESGDSFAARLLGGFEQEREEPQLVHIATDGESYGHHHRHGEMALARALECAGGTAGFQLTTYAAFLEAAPPTWEVEIHEDSSWSCVHGVERWRSDCGCNAGSGHHQRWRGPLREAFDHLRDELWGMVEHEGIFDDVWAARDDYIDVILERTPEKGAAFAARHAPGRNQAAALRWMEALRHAMLMYTSCGWFFDDIGGLEPRQCIAHALYAAELAGPYVPGVRERLLEDLAKVEGSLRGDEVAREEDEKRHVGPEQIAARACLALLIDDDPFQVAPARAPAVVVTERRGDRYLDAVVEIGDRGARVRYRAIVERAADGAATAQAGREELHEVDLGADAQAMSADRARADLWSTLPALATEVASKDPTRRPLIEAAFTAAADEVLDDPEQAQAVLDRAERIGISLDRRAIGEALAVKLNEACARLRAAPSSSRADRVAALAETHEILRVEQQPADAQVDLRKVLEERPELRERLKGAASRLRVASVISVSR